jgi:hypothetical protein
MYTRYSTYEMHTHHAYTIDRSSSISIGNTNRTARLVTVVGFHNNRLRFIFGGHTSSRSSCCATIIDNASKLLP